MAEAALAVVDEVLFVLPRVFPHKEYTAGGFEQRLALLRASLTGYPRFSLAASTAGLFIDLAHQARADYGPYTQLFLLCGRDTAERIVSWDYGRGESIHQQLKYFQLLVASRGGRYEPPPDIQDRVRSLDLPADLAQISSSEVRRRIRTDEPWRNLVPISIVPLVEAQPEIWSSD